MKVAIIGAGVIGVSTAYELAADGHEVTVFERRSAAAEETSFANAGIIAPGYVTPWAAPGMPGKMFKSLFQRHAPLQLGLRLSTSDLAWMWKWRRACKLDAYLANRSRLQRLAFYSRERLHALAHTLRLEYDRSDGYMVLLRTAQDAAMAEPGLQLLRDAGVRFQQIDVATARSIEPALCAETDFFGAIHLPDDEVGNCRQFTMLLKAAAQQLGAKFEFNRTVAQINPAPAATVSIADETTPRRFDAVVVCAGMASAALLKPLGVHIPLAAVYGYSLTANIREPLNAPVSAVMDEHYKVAISRMGQRVRVAGSAELGGQPDTKNPAAIATLYKVLHDWFPGAAQLASNVQIWKGARAMLPDGPPLVGASGLPGVWLNLGHGSSGWALACGSARATADLVAGHNPAIDMEGLGLERLRN
jgi:D-amino-acid dehydrogenase